MKKIFFSIIILCIAAALVFISCDTPDLYTVEIPVHVTGISLDRDSFLTLEGSGETFTLVPTIEPENATNKGVKWISSHPDVTTVDDNGKVTFYAAGDAIITATTYDGEYEAFCHIEVTDNLSSYISYIAENADGSGTVYEPIKLTLSIELGDPNTEIDSMSNPQSGWNSLLAALSKQPETYFDIDLSECTMPSDVFNFSGWPGDACINSITLPDAAKEIQCENVGTFYNIASVSGANVETIGDSAFQSCDHLTSVNFPNATKISDNAFTSCTNLKEANFPKVTEIGTLAFEYCTSLTNANFPLVTNILGSAFEECSSLTAANFPKVIYVNDDVFAGCSSLTEITLSPSLLSIGSSAFDGCSSLKEITLPDTLTFIGANAFRYCSSLTEITVPNTITSISDSTFAGCTNLTEVTLSATELSIGSFAFQNCTSLEKLTIHSLSLPTCGQIVFENVEQQNVVVYVPQDVLDAYLNLWSYSFVYEAIPN